MKMQIGAVVLVLSTVAVGCGNTGTSSNSVQSCTFSFPDGGVLPGALCLNLTPNVIAAADASTAAAACYGTSQGSGAMPGTVTSTACPTANLAGTCTIVTGDAGSTLGTGTLYIYSPNTQTDAELVCSGVHGTFTPG